MINPRSLYHAIVGCLLLCPGWSQAAPSFDCKKAKTPTETAICASEELSRLDRALKDSFTPYVDGSLDETFRKPIIEDQAQWLVRRDQCQADRPCLLTIYRARISTLNGDATVPFAGLFSNALGAVTVYPLAGRYLVHINTAEPKAARWVCDASGDAVPKENDLALSVDDMTMKLTLRQNRLTIVDDTSAAATASKYCGFNGFFSGDYQKKSPRGSK